MSNATTDIDVEALVAPERRPFVARLVAGTSFATPVVASYDMDALTVDQICAELNSNSFQD